jgi:hypothetical protein
MKNTLWTKIKQARNVIQCMLFGHFEHKMNAVRTEDVSYYPVYCSNCNKHWKIYI